MKFSDLPPYARWIWAKSGEPSGHGLLAHMLDVAAVAEVILAREPARTLDWAAAVFGLPRQHCARWLAALVGLHDFGKAIAGFQAKWPQGMAADQANGLSFPQHVCSVTEHSRATAALLLKPLSDAVDAERAWLRHALQAISAHHGFHFTPVEIHDARPKGEPSAWAQARQAIFDAYWQTLAPQGAPIADEIPLPAVNWLAGLTSIADWMASNPEWFALGERHDDLDSYYAHARTLADMALQHIHWSPARRLLETPAYLDDLLARVTGRSGLQARPLQQVGDTLLRGAQGPALLLVEAPMGEGKTELAFLAHLHLQAANEHRGLYVALPTQATGNALFTRTLTFLEAFDVDPTEVQLIHGGAWMNEEAQGLRAVRLRNINHDKGETLEAATWFSQRRRPLLSAYGVGTVDQALFAALNVKHHFVRLWGLGNRVVVLDEIHAYDTYTSGLIASLLQWLKALGSSVVLMSATLPRARRDELLAAWGAVPDALPALAYPRVLLADAQGVQGASFVARELPPITLKPLAEDLTCMANQALALLEGGGCGAIIVNTVDRAQQLYLLLRERLSADIRLLLFHARYPLDERAERERQVLTHFGPQGERPEKALLIATQVAEQSLDLDFDFMLSDLAPVDLLLQRAGRLHRHQRPRPALHRTPCLWVAGLQPAFPDLKTTAWQFVYDTYILGRTWALLQCESTLALPGDIDRLVQAVYGDQPLPAALDAQVQNAIEITAYGEYRAKVNKERQEACNVTIDPASEPQGAYSGKPRGNDDSDLLGLRNVTRLGRESITLIPVEVTEGGWRVLGMDIDPAQPLDERTARHLYARQLRLSRTAVVKHFQGMEKPATFAEHPWLRHCHLLPLSQGRYAQPSIQLRLDPELGLIYDPEDKAIIPADAGNT
ncbi:CRISPR-associated helicase/endonuclease Cas3 [Lysobacteraceae bacterium NML75-0749]|nr:CRISPR-associated helicase/endonuclease Cas3 [Xanthomonadaceae bacterium NML91-0268]PJK03631.1 CRISPR-associated helicase/endonuclease Cas3 [Xanthomonadaceae bacterium NML75-0749]